MTNVQLRSHLRALSRRARPRAVSIAALVRRADLEQGPQTALRVFPPTPADTRIPQGVSRSVLFAASHASGHEAKIYNTSMHSDSSERANISFQEATCWIRTPPMSRKRATAVRHIRTWLLRRCHMRRRSIHVAARRRSHVTCSYSPEIVSRKEIGG